MRGEIDSRSDDRLLWIRHEEEGIVLVTSVKWTDVAAATLAGETIEIEELQQRLAELASEGPRGYLTEYKVRKLPNPDQAPVALPAGVQASYHAPVSSRIVSIEVDAIPVNLDRDVEPDGLEVFVAAFNEQGIPVPVRGNLYARLWGQRSEPHGSPIRFESLQRWSHPVRQQDFVEGVASYPLRFRTVRPEFDFELWPDALLNVRLGVPGQGNYEATSPVMLRYFNPLRDRLQVYEGSRFFRGELSENVRRENRRLYGLGRGIRSR